MKQPVLELRNISKFFPGVRALSGVSLDIQPGEIHALVGENGAGKSTLLGVASGRLKPDQGELRLQGQSITLSGPEDGRRRGIAVIHQEAELFPDLSVAEWMAHLSTGLPTHWGVVDWQAMRSAGSSAIATLGEPIPPGRLCKELSAAERQVVEIAAAHGQTLSALFLDEPTTSLTRKEVGRLYKLLDELKAKGVGIVYVSHKLSEVFDLSDRITVLRDGEVAGQLITAETTEDEVVSAMVGRQVEHFFPKTERQPGESVFVSQGFSDQEDGDISFDLRAGEVLGLYGLVGAGRSEWAQTVIGIRKAAKGTISLSDRETRFDTPAKALQAGVVYLPEDRHVMGLFGSLSVRGNAAIATLRDHCAGPFLKHREINDAVIQGLQKLETKMASLDVPISTLSGGNQQKVILTRWLLAEPRILILDEPTRGIDVGAKAEVHRLIDELAGHGLAVVLISSELPEVMGMSDRILVIRDGQVSNEFQRGRWTEDAIVSAAFPSETNDPEVPANEEAPLKKKDLDSSPENHPKNQKRQSPAASLISKFFLSREMLLASVLFILATVLTVYSQGRFLSWTNLSDILLNVTPVILSAVGMTYVIVAGGIDISAGSLLAICACLAGFTAKEYGGIWLPVSVGIGAGLIGGAMNGLLSIAGRLHPILVTLGTMSLFRGIFLKLMGGKWIHGLPETFTSLGQGGWIFPYPVWIMLGVTAIGIFVAGWTRWGRILYAVGGNPHAAETIGLPSKRVQFMSFVVLGGLIGLAAVIQDARYGQVQGNTGRGFELQVIAAVVVGGTNIMGGSGTVLGTALAALLLGLTSNAMVFMEISTFYDKIVVGFLILAAVIGDGLMRRREMVQS